jgi:predicted CoA-substrate-specific enzyme activase
MGIDIGSSYGKALALDKDAKIITTALKPTGIGGAKLAEALRLEVADKIGGKPNFTFTVATGYGRVNVPFANKTLTEISCHARGVSFTFPNTKIVVDIGGQDSKVIVVGPKGKVEDFAMNDKCAAGTGRFLDVMAKALEVDISDLGQLHNLSRKRLEISSTCTVFAESEVISLLAQGEKREDIVAGLHRAICNRVYGLLKGRMRKISFGGRIVLTGGVARNQGMINAFMEKVGAEVIVSADPQFTGALGAAVIARELGS